ncbi:MAG: radical SAM protein [Planctomycetota bacterium]
MLIASAPHADTFGYSMPPPGLLRLGGEFERRGRSVALADLAYHLAAGDVGSGDAVFEACADLLLAHGGPRVALGISCMGATLPAALCVARAVRARRPDLCILLGGPGTSGIDRELVERFAWIDAVGRGEGEETFPALVDRAETHGTDFAGVLGATWREPSGAVRREADRPQIVDLGTLPPPAWHLVPELLRYKAITGGVDGLVPVDSGRGCVYDCSFCSIGRTWNRRSRTLPVARLVDEMESAAAMPGAREVYLCHDIFGADRRHALAVCAELERRGSRIPFEVRARVDHLDDELVDAMGRAGCYRVLLGIESGDAALRNAHGKRMDPGLDVLARVERLHRAGVASILSLVLGLPGEDDERLGATLDLCLDAALRAPVHLSLHLPNPQPACELGEQDGGRSRPVDGLAPDMAVGAGTTAPERALIDAHPDLFGTFAIMVEAHGGERRVRELARIAQELPPVLLRHPRTFAMLARSRREDVLGTFRAWAASGLSFEGFAVASDDERVREALDWERAIVRVSALGDEPPERVRAPLLVEVRFDPVRDTAAWRDAPTNGGEHATLAVLHRPGGARTVAIDASLAAVLRELDGRDIEDLAHDQRAFELVRALNERDLLRLPAARVPDPIHSTKRVGGAPVQATNG